MSDKMCLNTYYTNMNFQLNDLSTCFELNKHDLLTDLTRCL